MRKQKKISLFGRELILSERGAMDVLNLDRQRDMNDNDAVKGILYLAAALSDGMKCNWEKAILFKRWRLKKITSPSWLVEHLSLTELIGLKDILYELENAVEEDSSKKKDSAQAM